MPRYSYKCNACGQILEEIHSYKTVLTDCRLCGKKSSLVKDLSTPIPSLKPPSQVSRTGDEVNRAIGEAKAEVRKSKQDLAKRTQK